MGKNRENIEKILLSLPRSPWVYQMKDSGGKVMYVWKAKSLKNRVSSYFMTDAELSLAKRQMVGKIMDIEILTCQTEVEALVLETNLIKHLTPKYNILMKDDKNLAYLKITNSPIPELIKTRQKIRDGGEYFGPYVSAVEHSVRSLRKIFKIRNCRMKFAQKEGKIVISDKAGKTVPCMDYYIWLCPAPCLLERKTVETHGKNIENVRSFLKGGSAGIFDQLNSQMREKARIFEFEEAQKIKETINALEWLHQKQTVRDIIDGNIDICIKYEKYDKTYIALTQVRSSQIIGVFRHEITHGEWEDVIVQFLMRQYLDGEDVPDVLLLREEIQDEAFLDYLRNTKIVLEYPKIWPKNDIIDFTLTQLREYAYKRELATLENKTLTRENMTHVLDRLGYEYPKKWEIVFECYDISHTDGHFTYASRVVIVNGKPDPSRYKKYKIKTLEDGMIDDFASHREVMMRRTLEWCELNNFPHLIIIDGGKWQLSSAMSGIKEGKWKHENELPLPVIPGLTRNLEHLQSWDIRFLYTQEWQRVQICSIAKREEEIFLPGDKNPILFEKWTPELMVLQKARDEAHRFSITANKSARMKSMKKNILEELPGFGPVTRKKLLKLAGTVDEIKNISLEEIENICTRAQLETLRDHGIVHYL